MFQKAVHSLLLSWISFRKMDNKINFCGGGCCGLGGNDPLKLVPDEQGCILGPIMSRSKRFKSILMPDLDSTAKSYPRNNVSNIAGWFITKFCSSQSCLPCHDVSRCIFGAETPKIDIAVAYKTWKKKKKKKKLKFSGSSHFINTSYRTTHTHTKKIIIEGGVHTVQVSQV